MKRRIIMILLIFVAFILQCAVFPAIAVASIKPNIFIILTVSFALMRGKREGMFVGFCCGFLSDLFFGYALGLNALIYMYIGYLVGFCYRIFYDDDIKMPVLLTAGSDLAYSVVIYGVQFLMRGRIDFFFYLKRIMIPEMIYTTILTILCYRFLFALNHRLEKSEQRSVSSLV